MYNSVVEGLLFLICDADVHDCRGVFSLQPAHAVDERHNDGRDGDCRRVDRNGDSGSVGRLLFATIWLLLPRSGRGRRGCSGGAEKNRL